MACPNLPKCPFFNDRMAGMPAMASMLKSRYCEGDFAACARFKVAQARTCPQVPGDLFPNQHDRLPGLGVPL